MGDFVSKSGPENTGVVAVHPVGAGGWTGACARAHGRVCVHLCRERRDKLAGSKDLGRCPDSTPLSPPLHITSLGLTIIRTSEHNLRLYNLIARGTGILSCWLSGNEYALEGQCLAGRAGILV